MHSYPIYLNLEDSGSAKRDKGYGARGTCFITVNVGSSKQNSMKLAEIAVRQQQFDNEIIFSLNIDGQDQKQVRFNQKTKEFTS